MRINASELKESRFDPKLYLFAKLDDGSIEPLYYYKKDGTPDLSEPRSFYYSDPNYDEEVSKRGWYLDHDVITSHGFSYMISPIVEFATTKEELE